MEVILNQFCDEGASLRSIQPRGVMAVIHPKTSALRKGFTLIELLVVIAIIALISSIVFSALTSARAKARDANRIATARSLKTALTLYEDKNGSVINFGSGNMMATSSGSTTIDTLVSSGFLSRKIASDVIYGTSTYYLGVCNDGRYDVYTKVERPENSQSQSTLNVACGSTSATGNGFNYAYGLPPAGSGGGGVAAGGCVGNCVAMPAPAPPPPVSLGTLIAVGATHSCLVGSGGQAYCWGGNSSGELGTGNTTQQTSPIGVVGNKYFKAIALGSHFTCGLDTTGKAYCWGLNSSGQLGDGSVTSTSSPKAVAGGLTFGSITAGYDHACALDMTGRAYCWGAGGTGQRGDGTTAQSAVPVAVSTGSPLFGSIAAGQGFTCALDTSSKAYCWGYNNYGQLGDGTVTQRNSPTAVSSALSFTVIAAGRESACAISSQQGYCWGYNSTYGVDSSGITPKKTPTAISTSTPLSDISVGTDNACALNTSGAGMCWGMNTDGELGTATGDPVYVPTPVWGNTSTPIFTYLKMGVGGHTCGIESDGINENAFCWGADNVGQIGNSTQSFTPSNPTPQAVLMPW